MNEQKEHLKRIKSQLQAILKGIEITSFDVENEFWTSEQHGIGIRQPNGRVTVRINGHYKPASVGGPASASVSEGEQLPAEGQGEANTRAGFWCQNEMHGNPRCEDVCTYCTGYARRG